MTSFSYWQSVVRETTEGTHFMCMVCFDVFPVEEAYVDTIGQAWDECKQCDAEGKTASAAKREKAAGAEGRPERSESQSPDSALTTERSEVNPLFAPALEGPTVTQAAQGPPLPSQPSP